MDWERAVPVELPIGGATIHLSDRLVEVDHIIHSPR
jgi:hypothetical protein